ncbi:aldose 1-epimerase [Methylorubrum podarium]|jgi:aldose 1-epimerase|uniref:aldose 1-epimerase n=1 Tax=Methylorubrum podarium TaxID=200476 RepID=UPI001EE36D5F|nr:aldose 1-epimerase [Methylorubrum podarium]GJE69191.1 putative protein YphB [Methylorubrum podarium]
MNLRLENVHLGLEVTTAGGSVWRFFAKRDSAEMPIFREPQWGPERNALTSGCFPLVPFGNRIRGNRFPFEGKTYDLTPNMPWDRHYLHGDGWTGQWDVLRHRTDQLRLGFDHQDGATPYRYRAEETFALDGRTLTLTLSVTNEGPVPMPFGLGWHPYFPMSPRTTLKARMRSFWEEDEAWLPTVERPTGGDLDFATGAPLPRRWVNTQFEGWDRKASVTWPERDMTLHIDADPLFDRCLIFVSDPAFNPGYAYDFFCFEPMSHSIDDHNKPDGGGLQRLAPGEHLCGAVRFTLAENCDQ